MTTTPTPHAAELSAVPELPVVAYRRYSTFTGWYYWGDDHAEPGSPNEEDLTPLAPAQATIDELRAEVERLRVVEFNSAVQFRDAVQPLREEVERLKRERDEALADAKEIRARWNDAENEFAALKAKQIDGDAVMRLADAFALAVCDFCIKGFEFEASAIAAREALRAGIIAHDIAPTEQSGQ